MDFPSKIALIEAVKPDIAPMETQVHSLLLESVGKIADQWIEQLVLLRENTVALENQILASVAKTKARHHARCMNSA